MIDFTNSKHQKLLKVLTKQHELITNNISNADTPHYKATHVAFQDELDRILGRQPSDVSLKRTHDRHLPLQTDESIKVVESRNKTMNNNGNNVDIDAEMSRLAKNQLLYNYTIERVSGQYTKMSNLLKDLR
ncbi:flagellar basal body rod protein FlgB [Paenibacillus sambharensis]|uniref:Flagellar basal body rod protein FlgB n=1 Tax=Paenibacillus sambharensis TaxID=1803190 RepID=A0A2W1LH28_9BACL|nr:flagellar basal body rod protein FlgB [Paenibacillus sambharensis]PZD97370.1 flagellar basal body rod protein FlgB [Paenibacillus sambharensis]